MATALALSGSLAITSPAFGQGPVVSGDIVPVSEPPSLARNAFESNSAIALIEERANFALYAAVTVDVDGTPGIYNQQSDLTGGVIPEGAVVSIFLLHFDPIGVPSVPVRLSGSIQFPRPIAGLVFRHPTLTATDIYGETSITYPLPEEVYRGFEFGELSASVFDSASISADRLTLTLNWGATAYTDQLRVFTIVPEPLTASLLVIGLLGVSWRRIIGLQ